jgi:ATP-dependent Clp protease protease subunit
MSDRELTPLELRKVELENEQLAHEIRYSKFRAEVAALELEQAIDKERDRQAKPGITRRLNFFGDVSPVNVDNVIEALDHWSIRDPGKPITITFNTSGGSVTDGLALYDTLKRLQRQGHYITTRATGIAASMGAVLVQAGDVRIMDARAKMLIHEGSTSFGNSRMSAGEMEDYQTFSRMLKEDILDILSERSTLTRDEVKDKWSRKDWWITAAEALEYGFVDAVE